MNTTFPYGKDILINGSTPPWKKELIIRKRARSFPATNTNSSGGQTKVCTELRCPLNNSARPSNKPVERSCMFGVDFHLEAADRFGVPMSTTASIAVVGNMKFVSEVVERDDVNCAIGNRRRVNGISLVSDMFSKQNNSIDTNEDRIHGLEKRVKLFKSSTRFVSGCKMKDKIIFTSRTMNGKEDGGTNSDSSEELQYGPGIVNRLKTKYLSMTLRENQKNGIRPTLSSVMRKATSLDNLLEDEDIINSGYPINSVVNNCISKIEYNVGKDERKKSNGYSNLVTNDLKRARSMETLNEALSPNGVCIQNVKSIIVNSKPKTVIHQSSKSACTKICEKEIGSLNMVSIVNEDVVIVENTVHCKKDVNAKLRHNSVEDRELPPPDVVKETLKLFENCQPKCSKPKIAHRMNFKANNSVSNNIKVDIPKPSIPNKPIVYPKPTGTKKHFIETIISGSEINGNSSSSSQNCNNVVIDNTSNYNHLTNGVSNCKEVAGKVQSDNGGRETICISDRHSPPISILKVNFEHGKTVPLNNSAGTNKCDQKDDKIGGNKCNSDNDSRDAGILKTNVSFLKRYSTPLHVDTGKCSSSVPNDKSNKCDILKISEISPVRQVGIIRPLLSNVKSDSVIIDERQDGKDLLEKSLENVDEKRLLNCVDSGDVDLNSNAKTSSQKILHTKTDNLDMTYNNKSSALWSTQPWNQQQNTMIFNFSDRKEVPDYIENDGLLLNTCRNRTQKMLRENCGTPGVIILNNVHGGGICDDGEESSTDSPLSDGDETALDREDWNLINGPPSPCNIQFEGDNVVINGKSNLRKQPKDKKLKIQFNDSSTITFEYPSESSLLEDEIDAGPKEYDKSDDNSCCLPSLEQSSYAATTTTNNNNNNNASRLSSPTTVATSAIPSSVTGGGGNLASYVPSKSGCNEKFQLGITRSAGSAVGGDSSVSSLSLAASAKWPVKMSDDEENNNEQTYLKPAEETENVAWSEEALPDLLF